MTRSIDKFQLGAFALLGTVTITSVLAAFGFEMYYLAFIPFVLLIAGLAVVNFKSIYFLLLFAIPLSIEYYFSSSLATDLPDEPLMIGLMLVTMVYLARNPKALPTGFFGHFIIVALLIHLFWIFVTAITSVNTLVSIKVWISKIWYITTFSILTVLVLKTKEDFKKAFWCIFAPLSLLVVQVLVRYALIHFDFDEVNKPMPPFFRNHVNYAAIITIFFPFILLVRSWYPKGLLRNVLNAGVVLFLVGIYFSYTRTCYLAVGFILPFYLVVRYRLMKLALVGVGIGIIGLSYYLEHNNKYLDFAPEFTETTVHDEFGEHLVATFQGKDVSSMERVYRWVAIGHMFQDRPWFGFGAGNFYPYYKDYTVRVFETYVSENEEHSTAHNYPLLLLAEQGVIGVFIFFFLTAVIFIKGENIYHSIDDKTDKAIVLTLLVIMAMVYINLMLSDLVESDKVGPFFFMVIGLLAAFDIKHRLLKAKAE
ncbi:MAG: O-antigen ligase family protein [Chitinophagales bacterium]